MIRLVLAGLLLAAPALAADASADMNALLRKIVKKDGVDYKLLRKERKVLDAYVKSLETASPGKTREEQIAFWINAYNALTLQQVLDTRKGDDPKYSVQRSVKDFWKKRKWKVAGKQYNLDAIEQVVLKGYGDPRTHFAVNCASWSCPALQPWLWKADTLDRDLTQATRVFLADKRHNTFDPARRRAEISKVFEWYRKEFEKDFPKDAPRTQLFLAKYAPTEKLRQALTEGTPPWRITFKDYDWSLNEAGSQGAVEKGTVNWVWLVFYIIATGGLLAYGFHAYKMLRWRKSFGPGYDASIDRARAASPLGKTEFPRVLVQLPIFNEAAVAESAIDAVAALDWPADRLDIQVLDDSTDETVGIVDAVVARHAAAGIPIRTLRRSNREGFKAGALAEGLRVSDAEYVALFDADFLPHADFLRRGLPVFDVGENVACVQGRWGHVNRDQNWLTRAQAIAVDAHFLIQQYARAAAGRFLNFNGTAGLWRVSAIDAVGGWVGDTLTEDLDLSYRAQLHGWRIVFDKDLVVPAELPPALDAYKSQQRRWACGSIQCARKFLGPVWRSDLPFGVKTEATLHLCGYGVCVAMVMLIAVLPFGLGHWPMFAQYPGLWPVWVGIWIAALGPLTVTTYAQVLRGRVRVPDILACFLLGLGSCMNNAIAVFRGLFRPIRTFVRTPKQGASGIRLQTPMPVTEQVMTVFSVSCVIYLANTSPWATATYALFCCAGFCTLAGYWWLVERK
ncbi:MAG: glycosyltransferase [Planctomycetota bacterium]